MGMAVSEKFHVLAVDDSIIDRKLIERLLKTSSYQVTTVDSGSKALEFLGFEEEQSCSTNEPSVSPNSESHTHNNDEQLSISSRIKKEVGVNLVITDYCMPGMTGYDLLKKIKESSSLKNIPVVIMSSENVPSRINRCLEEGADEFFLKPVRLSDVNKLRPHMLKAMYDCDQTEHETSEDNLLSPELLQEQKTQAQQQQSSSSTGSGNKRKSVETNSSTQITIEEGLSPDRTRPRYSGLTVV